MRPLAINTAAGLVLPLLIMWLDRNWTWPQVRSALTYSMIYAHSIGTTVTLAFAAAGPVLGRLSRAKAWAAIVGILIVCAFAGCGIGTAFAMLTPEARTRSYWVTFGNAFQFSLPICLVIGLAVGAVEDVRDRLRTTSLQLRTKELERERAEKLAAEAKLSSLESRVQPHFLFNALNSVSALIREDPAAAERLIERLAALLRFSLDSHLGMAPLGRELKIAADYLEIEKARFGSRLRFRIEAPEELCGVEIPAMSIQTLVENSVKYAVSPRREGSEIFVRVSAGAGSVFIEVRDDGPGFTLESMRQGHGLDLLQGRLEMAFGSSAGLSVEGSTVTVTIPLRKGVAA